MAFNLSRITTIPARLRGLGRRIRRDERGMSVIEFAIGLPVFTAAAMYGLEISYMYTVNMQVSQLALSVADNASRLGQTDNSAVPPTISETDIDAVMFGAMEQGKSLKLRDHGRIILSSVERDSTTTRQFIHWQRCGGALDKDSQYGNDGALNGLTGNALRSPGVTARNNQAVMLAEVYYDYQPLFSSLLSEPMVIRKDAVFIVRDDRNLGANSSARGTTGPITSSCS